MLTIKTVQEWLLYLKVEYSIQISNEDLFAKAEITYRVCKELTNEEFIAAAESIIKSGVELYGKLPKSALFLEHAGKKSKSPEALAASEVEHILQRVASSCAANDDFKHEITRKCVSAYGGVSKLYFDLFDAYNPKPKERQWVKKELIEIWLDCYDRSKAFVAPLIEYKRSTAQIASPEVVSQSAIFDDFVLDQMIKRV